MGGLPRRATFISRQKVDLLPMILLDTGNMFAERPLTESALETTFWKAELIVTAMERMGYHAAVLGEMDLYLGLDRLKALSELGSVRFLSANLVDSNGDHIFEPYVMLKAGDLDILVIGLTQPPARQDLAARRLDGCSIHDPLGEASRLIPEVRSRCDLLIVLSSLGHSKDLELARSVEGIDIIIGGRNRHITKKAVIENGTLITSGYFQGRAVGQLMISYKGPVEGWVSSERLGYLEHQIRVAEEQLTSESDRNSLQKLRARHEKETQRTIYISDMINLDPSFSDDPEMVSMIEAYRRELNRAAALPRGSVSREVNPTHFTGPEACSQCHESRHRFWLLTRHARAYGTLEGEGRALDPDCLPCHVTGFGQASGFLPESESEELAGITCESCHGLGSLHVLSPQLYDLISAPAASLCVRCHTDERDGDFNYARDRGKVCSEEM